MRLAHTHANSRPIAGRNRRALLVASIVLLGAISWTPILRCESMNAGFAVPHPARRITASPSSGAAVTANPPSLLWPVVSGSEVRYRVRLSQSNDFSSHVVIRSDDQRWALFNPHQTLKPGTWYWQYGTIRRANQEAVWSPVYQFTMSQSARRAVTPPAAEMIAGVPRAHPRILVPADNLDLLRKRVQGSERLAASIRAADRLVDRVVRGDDAAEPTQQGKNAFEAKNFAKWASKGYAANVLKEVKALTLAYLLTGIQSYGDAAIERGLMIARLDPRGPTSRRVSDFADGSCMEAMALVYDCCYDQLEVADREKLRDAMVTRAAPWFKGQMNNLESRVFSAHIWQHILQQTTEVALALLGDVPEAELWLTYVYELWQARVPLLGGEDGGWANGLNYFGTNFKTLLEMPTLFERYTAGADFFDDPWYRNTVYYQLYAWPPGSASDGFGDGSERTAPPSNSRAMFVRFLGERFGDPAALWYARQVAGDADLDELLTSLLWFERVQRDEQPALSQPAPPNDLPQARAFRDVGVVEMHTNLTKTPENLMLAFRSSPYGSFNHMHADQNSFHLLFGGQRLLAGSGYYIGYGDDHFKDWYTHTRGQNSVLIDNRGQVRGAEGYGWIARYLHGQEISYCTGDASSAYGDAGLTRFRRHLVLLRPGIVVVYDDLAADHPADWSWLLHSSHRIVANPAKQRLSVASDTARAQVDLSGSTALQIAVSDQFDPPAVNWRKKTSGGEVLEYPDQWHVTAAPNERSEAMRFLAIIQVGTDEQATSFETPKRESDDVIRVADWRIAASMDSASPASLLIERSDGGAALAVDCPEFSVGATHYASSRAESMLVEGEGHRIQRCHDGYPTKW